MLIKINQNLKEKYLGKEIIIDEENSDSESSDCTFHSGESGSDCDSIHLENLELESRLQVGGLISTRKRFSKMRGSKILKAQRKSIAPSDIQRHGPVCRRKFGARDSIEKKLRKPRNRGKGYYYKSKQSKSLVADLSSRR